jgi:hypothetical protein
MYKRHHRSDAIDYNATKKIFGEQNRGKPYDKRKRLLFTDTTGRTCDSYPIIRWEDSSINSNRSKKIRDLWRLQMVRRVIRRNKDLKNNYDITAIEFFQGFGTDIFPVAKPIKLKDKNENAT